MMYETTVGNIHEWYRGHGQDGREYLVTVWDNDKVWVQYRDTAADSFGRPVVLRAYGPHTSSDAS